MRSQLANTLAKHSDKLNKGVIVTVDSPTSLGRHQQSMIHGNRVDKVIEKRKRFFKKRIRETKKHVTFMTIYPSQPKVNENAHLYLFEPFTSFILASSFKK